ncbi:MAG: hypothetical protein HY927_10515 [Elusimicrobia bacterium]|nr:hypothetical protein [Elusimicrobiota bacterium]
MGRRLALLLALPLACPGQARGAGPAAPSGAVDWSFFTGVEGDEGAVLKNFMVGTPDAKGGEGMAVRAMLSMSAVVRAKDGSLTSEETTAVALDAGKPTPIGGSLYALDAAKGQVLLLKSFGASGQEKDGGKSPLPVLDLPLDVGKKWRFKMPVTDLLRRLAPHLKGLAALPVTRAVAQMKVLETPAGGKFDTFAVETRDGAGRLTQTDYYAKGVGLVGSVQWNPDGRSSSMSVLMQTEKGTKEGIRERFKAILAGASGPPAAGGGPAGPTVTTVRPKAIDIRVPLHGTVEAEGVFRLKANMEGRVEAVTASAFAWAASTTTLGLLSTKELAAIIEARGNSPEELLQPAWQKRYKLTGIFCPERCFILKVHASPRQKVAPNAPLFEAAKKLRLAGRVDPPYADYLRSGQQCDYWPVGKPSEKRQAAIAGFQRAEQGGGTFSLDLPPEKSWDPGTRWEGQISIKLPRRMVGVPTAALFAHDGAVYLAVKVSTGLVTGEFTEIKAGAEEGRHVLLLDHARVASAPRHEPGEDALRTLQDEIDGIPPRPPVDQQTAPVTPQPKPKAKRPPKPKKPAPVEKAPPEEPAETPEEEPAPPPKEKAKKAAAQPPAKEQPAAMDRPIEDPYAQ